ncbi:MAG TPA: M3 family metallopeptidase [Candidatus Nitrosotalea sp.]|nr:M3 family metallopeptidase [Candidatus Nitrosotalea sp.]
MQGSPGAGNHYGGVKALATLALAALVAAAPDTYSIDLNRYFSSAAAEAQSRAAVLAEAKAFAASATPVTAPDLLRWLQRYDSLLKSLERHDIYVYINAEKDERDEADAKADDTLGAAEDLISDRIVEEAASLGNARILALTQSPALRPYRYLLLASLAKAAHRLSPAETHSVNIAVMPVLDAAAASYKALRKSNASVESNQEAYAALLVSIASARNGVARLRGFATAAQESYFVKGIAPASVERVLAAVRASDAYARYRSVTAKAPKSRFTPPNIGIAGALALILAAEQPMGTQYAGAYAQLLNPANRRLEICTAPECDATGFSVGFAGVESGVFFGGYNGTVRNVRALAHESGHAVHRQFVSQGQPIAAYNRGPSFMFESFAIFNELLFIDHLYKSAPAAAERAYYLNYFLDDATFQVFGSAEETDLESAIYRGVDDGTLKTAAGFNALTLKTFARYDPASAQDQTTPLSWARNRLFFTDPLYDVNYLYAGLLALEYFARFERDPAAFSTRYVALLKNGFDDSPAALEKRFLGIDLTNEQALVANASALIEERTLTLRQAQGDKG